MKIKQLVKIILTKFSLIWSFFIPNILIFLALVWIAIISSRDFWGGRGFTQLFTIYITTIGIFIALATVIFTYRQSSDDSKEKEFTTQIGLLFLYAAISLIMALLLGWLAFSIREETKGLSYYTFTKYIAIIIFSFHYMFLLFAVNSFHTGLTKLEKHLFFVLRRDIM